MDWEMRLDSTGERERRRIKTSNPSAITSSTIAIPRSAHAVTCTGLTTTKAVFSTGSGKTFAATTSGDGAGAGGGTTGSALTSTGAGAGMETFAGGGSAFG